MDNIIAQLAADMYQRFDGGRSKKADISEFSLRLSRVLMKDFLAHHFLNYPGDYCRKLMLVTLEYWHRLSGKEILGIFDLLEGNELAKHYLLIFCARYLQVDCRNYIQNGQEICFHESMVSSKDNADELDRLLVNRDYLTKAQETMKNTLLSIDIQRKVETQS